MARKVVSAKPNAKTALLAKIAASSGLSNKQVTAVLDALANQIKHSLDTIGTITILDLVKIEKKTVATCPTWPAYIKATVLPELLPGPDAYCTRGLHTYHESPATNKRGHLPVRLLGMGVSGLDDTGLVQGMLFDGEERDKQSRVDAVADQIKERFGQAALRRGSGLDFGEKPTSN